MSFPHNNFLTGATSDADIAVVEILDTYFKKDGSIPMTKPISIDNQPSAENPPPFRVIIYSKNDNKLYLKNSSGDETDLTGNGTLTNIATSGLINGLTLSSSPSPITTSGTVSLGGTLAISNLDWSGADLAILNGGTGQSTPQLAINALSGVSGASADQVLTEDSGNAVWKLPQGITNIATSGSINGLTLSGGPIISTGTITLGGTLSVSNLDWVGADLAILNGGTGQSTAQLAINALSGVSGASVNDVLHKNGSNASWSSDYVRHSTTSTANRLCLFSGTTGKLIKESSEFSIDESDSNKLIFKHNGDSAMVPVMQFKNCFYGLESGSLLSPGTDVQNNTAIGANCFTVANTGTLLGNVAIGESSLENLAEGIKNISVGTRACKQLISGHSNTVLGMCSMENILTGIKNVGIGTNTGNLYTSSESNNILIGDSVTGTNGESDVIRIGKTQTKAFIKGIHDVTIADVGDTKIVLVNSDGELGTALTSLSIVGGKYSQCSGDVVIENTTTETTMINDTGAVGSLTFASDEIVKGDNYHIRIAGLIDCDNKTDELTLVIKLGSSTIWNTIPSIDLEKIDDSLQSWELEVDFTFRSIGAAGVVKSAGQFIYIKKNTAENVLRGWTDNGPDSITINTTLSNIISATAQWSDADPDNRLVIRQFMITKTF